MEDYHRGAISPDGQRFVFEATVDGRRQLVLRDMASTALVVLTGTEGGFRSVLVSRQPVGRVLPPRTASSNRFS